MMTNLPTRDAIAVAIGLVAVAYLGSIILDFSLITVSWIGLVGVTVWILTRSAALNERLAAIAGFAIMVKALSNVTTTLGPLAAEMPLLVAVLVAAVNVALFIAGTAAYRQKSWGLLTALVVFAVLAIIPAVRTTQSEAVVSIATVAIVLLWIGLTITAGAAWRGLNVKSSS